MIDNLLLKHRSHWSFVYFFNCTGVGDIFGDSFFFLMQRSITNMVLETWGRFAHVRKVCALYVYVHVALVLYDQEKIPATQKKSKNQPHRKNIGQAKKKNPVI